MCLSVCYVCARGCVRNATHAHMGVLLRTVCPVRPCAFLGIQIEGLK